LLRVKFTLPVKTVHQPEETMSSRGRNEEMSRPSVGIVKMTQTNASVRRAPQLALSPSSLDGLSASRSSSSSGGAVV
jgi:hypothetical protein